MKHEMYFARWSGYTIVCFSQNIRTEHLRVNFLYVKFTLIKNENRSNCMDDLVKVLLTLIKLD